MGDSARHFDLSAPVEGLDVPSAVAERLGDHNLLHLNLEGVEAMVAVTSDGNRRVAECQAFSIGLLANKCHLFRADGGACSRHYREPALHG